MNNVFSLDDFTSRLMPLTYFRRNAGEVMARLSVEGTIFITKGGKPIAKLSVVKVNTSFGVEKKIKKLKKLSGGFHLGKDLTPDKMNKLLDRRYEEMLPR